MPEFRMPALGADMEVGTVVEWRVKPGDVVRRGDIVALVETEKGLIEIEIFESGVVESLVVPEGQKVPVGAVLAMIRTGEGTPAPRAAKPPPTLESPPPPAAAKEAATPPGPAPSPAPAAMPSAGPQRLRITPLARKTAAALGVDLATVAGTGDGGAVTEADVVRAAGRVAAAPPAPKKAQVAAPADRQAAMRRVIAVAMARSNREIPHYYLGTHIDMSRAMAWLAEQNARRPVTDRLLYAALLIRAVALAVLQVPEMNGFCIDGTFTASDHVHVGVAIALRQGGLVVPAIHDVDTRALDELTRHLLDLVNRARAGVLRSSEVSDATITVTNLGEQGVETVFGVIYPPQVALVGFGKIVERPWAAAGMVGVRPVIAATLAADHRVSDGHRGGRFLSCVDRLLQEPEKL